MADIFVNKLSLLRVRTSGPEGEALRSKIMVSKQHQKKKLRMPGGFCQAASVSWILFALASGIWPKLATAQNMLSLSKFVEFGVVAWLGVVTVFSTSMVSIQPERFPFACCYFPLFFFVSGHPPFAPRLSVACWPLFSSFYHCFHPCTVRATASLGWQVGLLWKFIS